MLVPRTGNAKCNPIYYTHINNPLDPNPPVELCCTRLEGALSTTCEKIELPRPIEWSRLASE
jgi:hypothetical protein